MFKFLCAVALSATLTGCYTMQSISQDITAHYLGKPVEAVIKDLGMPSREATVAGRKAYIWEIGEGDCKLQMEVSPEDVVKDVRLSGYEDSCNSFNVTHQGA